MSFKIVEKVLMDCIRGVLRTCSKGGNSIVGTHLHVVNIYLEHVRFYFCKVLRSFYIGDILRWKCYQKFVFLIWHIVGYQKLVDFNS